MGSSRGSPRGGHRPGSGTLQTESRRCREGLLSRSVVDPESLAQAVPAESDAGEGNAVGGNGARSPASALSPTDATLAVRNKELSALVAMAETISRSLDLQTILNDALDKVLEIVDMKCGEVLVLDPETGRLQPRAARGVPRPPLPDGTAFGVGEGVPRRVVEAGRPLIVYSTPDNTRLSEAQKGSPPPYAVAGVPLMARGQVAGVMLLYCTKPCPPGREAECDHCVELNAVEVSLLLAMGQQIGMAIENARLWEELKRKEKNRAYLLNRVITAQEEERRRIARELHDGAGQSLTSLLIGLKRLRSAHTPDETQQMAAELRAMAARTLDEVRNLALELRPSVLDDMGLSVALQRYCQEYERRTGIRVDFHRDGLETSRLAGSVEIAIYRIVQEALTNVAKHAGARNVSVLLRAHAGKLRAIIEDDGVGFDVAATLEYAPEERKLGLIGIQERAGLLGGTCTFESRPGAGCTVFIETPLTLEGEPDE